MFLSVFVWLVVAYCGGYQINFPVETCIFELNLAFPSTMLLLYTNDNLPNSIDAVAICCTREFRVGFLAKTFAKSTGRATRWPQL